MVCTARRSEGINNIDKKAKFVDNGARGASFSSFDDRGVDEYNGAGLVQIAEIFATQDDLFV